MPILAAEGLVKIYGRRRVVDGVSLEVAAGEIVGLLGPNGAGKTTSFKMICGLVKPDKGKVFLQGADVTRWPMHERSRAGGMGYLPQQSSVFGKLSAEENLRGMMQLLGFSRRQQKARCEELLEQFKITHIRKLKAGTLSGGERRRLEIARSLVSEPKIIMLDEPFAGIDPVTVQSVQVVIKELARTGISILITDHAAREILQITDRTYVVSEGRILCSGTAEQIVAHEEVKKKYLGEIEMPAAKVELDSSSPVVSFSPTREPIASSSPKSQSRDTDDQEVTISSADDGEVDSPTEQSHRTPAVVLPSPTPGKVKTESAKFPRVVIPTEDRTKKQEPAGVSVRESKSQRKPMPERNPITERTDKSGQKKPETSRSEQSRSEQSRSEQTSHEQKRGPEQDVLAMMEAVNQLTTDRDKPTEKPAERPRIVFSKPRRKSRKLNSPFKSTDLD